MLKDREKRYPSVTCRLRDEGNKLLLFFDGYNRRFAKPRLWNRVFKRATNLVIRITGRPSNRSLGLFGIKEKDANPLTLGFGQLRSTYSCGGIQAVGAGGADDET